MGEPEDDPTDDPALQAAIAGDWEAAGLDAPAAPAGDFAPATVHDFLNT